MKHTLVLSFAGALLLLAGCATVSHPPAGEAAAPSAGQPQPGQPPLQPGQAGQPGQPQPPEAAAIAPVQQAEMSQNRAVLALLDHAQTEVNAGQRDAAGASLERALHIEPRNPWVWQQLAQVRLDEGRYDLAISLARKSNSFSGGKRRVQAVNWQLIGKARVAKGDSAGADEAFKKAADLAELAKAEK